MSAEEIRAKVVELAEAAKRGDKPVEDGTLLELDLGLDWLDRMELAMEVEDALGIEIETEEVDGMKTVGDLVKAAQEAARRRGRTRRGGE